MGGNALIIHEGQQWYLPGEAATETGMSESWIRKWIRIAKPGKTRPFLRSRKFGGHYRYLSQTEVDRIRKMVAQNELPVRGVV